jgi:hypothetical protein
MAPSAQEISRKLIQRLGSVLEKSVKDMKKENTIMAAPIRDASAHTAGTRQGATRNAVLVNGVDQSLGPLMHKRFVVIVSRSPAYEHHVVYKLDLEITPGAASRSDLLPPSLRRDF